MRFATRVRTLCEGLWLGRADRQARRAGNGGSRRGRLRAEFIGLTERLEQEGTPDATWRAGAAKTA